MTRESPIRKKIISPQLTLIVVGSQSGLTLIELVASLVGLVTVFGASIGFLLTTLIRQNATLDSVHLDRRHSALAQQIGTAIKTADRVLIFGSRSDYNPNAKSSTATEGNFLVCEKDFETGTTRETINQTFEFQNGPSSGTIVYSVVEQGSSVQYGKVNLTDAENKPLNSFFKLESGIVVASWSVTSSLDWIPYEVWAVPISHR
jgi:hypothetical protein